MSIDMREFLRYVEITYGIKLPDNALEMLAEGNFRVYPVDWRNFLRDRPYMMKDLEDWVDRSSICPRCGKNIIWMESKRGKRVAVDPQTIDFQGLCYLYKPLVNQCHWSHCAPLSKEELDHYRFYGTLPKVPILPSLGNMVTPMLPSLREYDEPRPGRQMSFLEIPFSADEDFDPAEDFLNDPVTTLGDVDPADYDRPPW